MNAIKVKNLKKQYTNHLKDKETIFSNLSFEASPGEVTLIMGSSGSGKTSLLNIISTIDPVEEGSVIIGNCDIHNMNENKRALFRASNIGFIFQTYALIPEFSIIDNCTIPLLMNGYNKKKAIQKASEMLYYFIPDINIQKYPAELSGGQQQRVAIARALVHSPSYIFADEPTGNLDSTSALNVKKTLSQIAKDKNICVVIVSHANDFIKYADKLYEFEVNKDYKEGKKQIKSQLFEKNRDTKYSVSAIMNDHAL